VDLEAELIRRRAAVAVLEEPADVLHVPRRGEVGRGAARREDELLGERGPLVLGGDEALLAHPLEDVPLAADRLLGPPLGVVAARCLGQTGQERRLRDRQVLDRGVEELARGGGDSVGAGAEVIRFR
jgi:hypothetical protein